MAAQKQSGKCRLAAPALTGHSGDGRFVFIDSERNVIDCDGYRAAPEKACAAKGLGYVIELYKRTQDASSSSYR